MVDPSLFYKILKKNNVLFFTGVPDSLLKEFCACIIHESPNDKHIIAANEGNAMAIAAGYYLASGKIPLVYLQNSGMGNIINPLLSLCSKSVYSIPSLIMIGWRGEPGMNDEPQHMKQGELTIQLLKTLEVPYSILSNEIQNENANHFISQIICDIKKNHGPYALVVKKGSFSSYNKKPPIKNLSSLTREKAIAILAGYITNKVGKNAILSTTGHISRELYEYRKKSTGKYADFMNVGSMGHVSQIALGISFHRHDREIFCFDGDGSILMHMGGMALVAVRGGKNYHHILFNNGVHGSVGSQPTIGNKISFSLIAKNMGYRNTFLVSTEKELSDLLSSNPFKNGPNFLEILVSTKVRKELCRPTEKPNYSKVHFMKMIAD